MFKITGFRNEAGAEPAMSCILNCYQVDCVHMCTRIFMQSGPRLKDLSGETILDANFPAEGCSG